MSETQVTTIPPPEVAEAFSSAAITTLQELARFEAFSEEFTDATYAAFSECIVSAAVRLVRDVPGKMTLLFTSETAMRLAARYLPEGTALIEDIIDDVSGEFANVIAGQAKTILKGTPYHFTMSTPAVTRTSMLSLSPVVAESPLVISLATEAGQVLVLVSLAPCPGA